MPATDNLAVTFADILAAEERIRPLARQTPVFTSRLFDRESGRHCFFKCENLQRGGAFKIRGAANFLLSLDSGQRSQGVVAYSSGNHAQAVAIAASELGVKARILMPSDAPAAKLDSTRAYGPEIILYDRERESREELAHKLADQTGSAILPPYDHPWVIAGQGTVALELLREIPDLDAIVVPLGGGGLLAGTVVSARGINPEVRVFGVEPELADDWIQSLAIGEPVEISPPLTIADGLRTVKPGRVTFPIVQSLASGVVTVSDDEIRKAVRFLLSRLKLVVEPSGTVGAAAVLASKLPEELRKIGVVLTGGNIDLPLMAQICQESDSPYA